ncbi:LysE family translocator [Herbidospora cretacea]|uniref:LysE family translocator n=1 Tax=Herbidospora cretacea TaxID=28444 RepID=UPI000773987E|nr:LysE family translocator [Herbidospora cretacea]
MEWGALVGIAVLSLGMVLTPGPNMIYLASRAISQGRRAGLVSLTGTFVGFVVYLTATCLGLTAIFALVPAAYTAIKLAGAAYLLWLAWKTLKPGGQAVFSPKELPRDSNGRLFSMGLVTNLLNPKVAILYMSLLPQFIEPAHGHVILQSFMLGSVQISISILVNAMIVLGAGGLAAYLSTRPTAVRIQRYVTGSVLGAFAVRLAADRSEAVLATP